MHYLDQAIDRFAGRLVIIAPHMDDEVLACGGLIARLREKKDVHIVYATDGMKSPAPILQGRDVVPPDLGDIRRRESIDALRLLGIPEGNLHFLGLPEASLKAHRPELHNLIVKRLEILRPDHVLVPFRFDRHPDHLAVNRVVTDALLAGCFTANLWEYFVYHRWRLLPGGDVRRYLKHDRLFALDIGSVASLKRAALACFRSQTTRYYSWQTRPILTQQLLDEECMGREYFLRYQDDRKGTDVFTRASAWIRLAHTLEPRLQRWKFITQTALQRALRRSG